MTEHPEHHDDAGVAPDPDDESVRSLLRGAVGEPSGPTDARAELAALRPRFERARRRREAGVAGSVLAAAAVAAIVVLSTAGGGVGRTQQVDVAGSDGGATTTSTTGAGPSTSAATPSSTATTAGTAPSTTVAGGPGSTAVPEGSVPPQSTVPSRPTTTPATPTTTPPTTSPPAPVTQVLDSDGGTATVRWTPTSIVVVSTAPAGGWTVEEVKQESATRVVVKFRRDAGGPGSSSAAIDARVVGGELRVDS